MPPKNTDTVRQPKNLVTKAKALATSSRQEKKEVLSFAGWILLASGAGFIDVGQWALEAVGVGVAANPIMDLIIGPTLAFFFWTRGVLDTKLSISLLCATAADAGTDGIMPAWIMDIGYAWLVTDGSEAFLGKIPFIGGAAKKALVKKVGET